MTVSPEWPQDGDRRPKADDNGVESGDNSNEPALPPTLFKLPDLNREEEGRRPQPAALNPQDDPADTPPENDAEEPTDDTNQPTADQPGADQPSAKQPSGKQEDPKKEKDAAPPRAPLPPATDQPAGRSWMETFGSHGMVVVLLMTVVGAALISNRNTTDLTLEPLADSEPVAELASIEPPIPAHSDHGSTDQVWLTDVDSYAQDQHPASYSSQPKPAVASPMADGFSLAHPTATLDAPLINSERPLVSLEPPQVTVVATKNETPAPQLDLPRGNLLLPEPKQVDVFTASDRFDATEGSSTLPTLKDWFKGHEESNKQALSDPPKMTGPPKMFDPQEMFDNQGSTSWKLPTESTVSTNSPTPISLPASSGERREARKFGSKYRYSSTPTGIMDWSRYFPDYQPGKAASIKTNSTFK
jgi:hypothetical protein